MTTRPLLQVILLLLFAYAACAVEKVILDTDIGGDIDDAGAMAILHSLSRRGEIEILAIGVVNGHVNTVPYVHAINTFFGRPDIPIGTLKGTGPYDRDKYMGPLLGSYPHSLTKATAPDVVALYRKVLAAQPDRSVTLIVVGQCTNISRLLDSGPDAHSPLNGVELLRRKIRFYAAGGNGDGQLPSGRCGHNYRTDLASANNELAKLPIEFETFFAGGSGPKILAGNGLNALPADDIIRRSYSLYFKGGTNLNRPTWDQLRVLYACRPAERSRWTHAGNGTISLTGETITWTASPQRNRSYGYVQNLAAMQALLESLMAERATAPVTPIQLPFKGGPISIPGRIEAEEYDAGGQGISYFDTTTGNDKGLFRNDDVDLRAATADGFSVGGIRAGEWLEYTVAVQTTGRYDLSLRIARQPTGNSTVRVRMDDGEIAVLSVPSTGSWSSWNTIVVPQVHLEAGAQRVLRVAFDHGYLDVDWIHFDLVSASVPSVPEEPIQLPFRDVPMPIPGRIEAEEYDKGGQGISYFDTTTGNDKGLFREDDVDLRVAPAGGFSVGGIRAGEWLEYTVAVQTTGHYDLSLRMARQPTGSSTVRMRMDDGEIAVVSVPSTGSWSSWTTVVLPQVHLVAGTQQVLRVAFDHGNLDVDWVQFDLVEMSLPTANG